MSKKQHEPKMTAEEAILKYAGVILTLLVVVQIIVVKGVHVLEEVKASLLESHEIIQSFENDEEKETYHATEEIKESNENLNEDEETSNTRREIEILENLEPQTALIAEADPLNNKNN